MAHRVPLLIVFWAVLLFFVQQSHASWTNEITLTSRVPAQGATFGRAIRTFGDFVVVGEASNGGEASIYVMPDDQWVEQIRLKRYSTDNGSFAAAVGMEDGLTAIGSPHLFQMSAGLNYTDSERNKPASVFVYTRTANSWALGAKMTSLQPGADGFGAAIAMGGRRLVVGAPYACGIRRGDGAGVGVTIFSGAEQPIANAPIPEPDEVSQSCAGAAYTYELNNGTWRSTGAIVAWLAQDGDLFGWSIDISADGSRLVIGSPGSKADGQDSGSAYVYTAGTDGRWDLEDRLLGSDETALNKFGYSVALDVSDAIIGTSNARTAYIFHKLATGWIQDAKLVGSDTQLNDGFGSSVAIFGTYALVGAPLNMARGAAYLWELDMKHGSWVQSRKFTASLPSAKLGETVAIGSRFMLAGAPAANHDIGHVLTLMFDSEDNSLPSTDTNLEDVVVLIRFSGSSSAMDLLLSRKIISEAAGTGTAQTEVRIVDLDSRTGPIANHLFGVQIRFTSSATMPAGTAARNLIAALPDIRYRLNTAVGAISGAAEIIASNPPEKKESRVSLEQIAAVIFLILATLMATALTIYLTMERRKRIAADVREAEAMEAEREARKAEMASRKGERRPKVRRTNVLRGNKKKDRSFLQAENDAAGMEFGDTFFGDEEFPISPRGYDDPGTARLDYDPTESLENLGGQAPTDVYYAADSVLGLPTADDGPSISMDTFSTGNALADDGPSIDLDAPLPDGPTIPLCLDDGPRIDLSSEFEVQSVSTDVNTGSEDRKAGNKSAETFEYPYDMSIGPEYEPRIVPSLASHHSNFSSIETASKVKQNAEDVISIPMDDGPNLEEADGAESQSFNATAPSKSDSPSVGCDQEQSKPRRPANVPRLNFGK